MGRKEKEPGHFLVHHLKTVTNQMSESVPKLSVSTTETVYRPPVQRDILYQECLYLSVILMEHIDLNSVIVPLDIVGVWTVTDKRDRELGHHLVQHPKTVTNQMNQSVLKLTVSTTETGHRAVQRHILEPLYLSVILMDSTYNCSATAPLDIVGAWTIGGRREQEPGLHLAQHPQTVTNQMCVLKLTVSSAETA